jgi:hypothetical protein
VQLWRQTEQEPETSRADIILASKPEPRPGGAARRRGLLDVIVPRFEPRQNHERHEDRRVLTGVTARVMLGGGKPFETAIANLSSNGMMIACERIAPIGAEVSAEIDGCGAVPMVVRWVRGGRIGLEFVAETTIVAEAGVQQYIIDTIRAEDAATRFAGEAVSAGPEKRDAEPRHALMWVCELATATAGGAGAARLRNISRSGAMISFGPDLAPAKGETVALMMGEESRLEAEVRWVAEGLAGLRFADRFPVETLIDQPCAHIVEAGDDSAPGPRRYASREEAMRIEYTGMASPYEAPAMDYRPLTLRELYTTLYTPVDPVES